MRKNVYYRRADGLEFASSLDDVLVSLDPKPLGDEPDEWRATSYDPAAPQHLYIDPEGEDLRPIGVADSLWMMAAILRHLGVPLPQPQHENAVWHGFDGDQGDESDESLVGAVLTLYGPVAAAQQQQALVTWRLSQPRLG